MPTEEEMNEALSQAKSTKPATPIGNIASAVRPASSKPSAKQAVVNDRFDHEAAFKVAFLGIGQGGGRMADAFWRLGYGRVAVMNTTDMDFKGLNEEIPKLNLEIGGAGKDAGFAAAQLQGREEEVWDLLTRSWGNDLDYGLICAGLGGGTGSGMAPRLVETARRYLSEKGREPKVGAIVSLPSTSEGQRQCRNAVTAFHELVAMKVSPLLIIDNNRIHELFNKPSVTKLYPLANENVAQLFHLFNRLAAVHSEHITFDRSELGQLLDGGIAVMGAADILLEQIKTPADISSRIREELANNVMAAVDLRRGKKAACLFVGSAKALDELNMDYFEAGFNQLNRIIGSAYKNPVDSVVHRGLYQGEAEGLQAYAMIGELEPPIERLAQLAKAGGMKSELQTVKGLAAHFGV